VPAVDLAVRLGFTAREPSKRTCLLVLEMQVDGLDFTAGIIVDEVRDLLELGESDIEPPPRFGSGIKVEFIRGVHQRGERPLLLLDVVRVFRDDELLQIALAEQRLRTQNEQKKPPPKAQAVPKPRPKAPAPVAAAPAAATPAPATSPAKDEELDWNAAKAAADDDGGVHLFDEE